MPGDSGASDEQKRFPALSPQVRAICVLWLVAFGPIVQPLAAAGAPRMALTDAIVSHGTIRIDGYLVGVDFVERDGHLYSDKAVGQQILAVPPYAAALAVGAEPSSHVRIEANLTHWWVTLWSSGVPFLALVVMMAASTRRRGPPLRVSALLGLAFGTMLLPYSVTLFGHVLGAAFGFGAWMVLDGDDRRKGRAWLGGALVGLAVLVEYQMAIVAVVLGIMLALRRTWGALARYVLAGIPFLVSILWYQHAAFGSPFRSGYQTKKSFEDSSVFITGLPDPLNAWLMLFGSRGLLLFMPIVAVGLVGLVIRWRRRREEHIAVALAIVLGFLLIQAGWPNPYGGDSVGPRYVLPALPFLCFGVAEIWTSVPRIVRRYAVGISVFAMVVPSVTDVMARNGWLIVAPLSNLFHNGPVATLFTMGLGPFGWVPHLLLIGWALWRLRPFVVKNRTV